MTRDALVLAASVTCALGIMGWIVWSERPSAPPPADTAASDPVAPGGPPAVDAARAAELEAAASADPEDAESRIALGNLYFGAHTFEAAIPWYEEALALRPDDLQSSTNLGVSYFYAGEAERALAQFERSLAIEPDHPQTLLNVGIVRAFGLDDVDGATAVWERVLEVAPDGPEAQAAREALTRVAGATPSGTEPDRLEDRP